MTTGTTTNETPSAVSSWRREALAGLRDTAPILPGVLPFGMIYGATAVAVGISPLMAQAMSVAVFAGASQVAAVDLLARDAAWITVLGAVLVINSRFVMYAAAVGAVLPRLRGGKGMLASYLLTDQGFAVTVARSQKPNTAGSLLPYYLGASAALWTTWQTGTAVGIAVGGIVPPSWELEFSIPLMFLALLIPTLKDRPSWIAAVVAGAAVLLGRDLPHNLGLMVGSLLGIGAGLVAERGRPGEGERP